jgi:hypothetical protein
MIFPEFEWLERLNHWIMTFVMISFKNCSGYAQDILRDHKNYCGALALALWTHLYKSIGHGMQLELNYLPIKIWLGQQPAVY